MNAPYLLIPIGLILLILYGISLLFSRLGILGRTVHRRIWNYALLATFLTAACLGILMAIQINYKLEVPWTEKVLKWHVNFGIGMSLVGLFHLIWHWSYYIPLRSFRRSTGQAARPYRTEEPELPSIGIRNPVLFPLAAGFSGIAFQTFMIRELLGLFQGNELMLSIILFLWLLINGAGAFAGTVARTNLSESGAPDRRRSWLLVLALFLIPLLSIPLMYYLKTLFFAPGIEAGPAAFSGFLLLILTPFCFLNGFSITFVARLLNTQGLNIRRAYGWESIGGMVAGVLCTLAILAGLFGPPGARRVEKMFHPNEEITASRTGPAGRLTITRSGDQVNIYENGILAQSSGNTMICEEMAHFAMIQHPDPQNILVIGGLLSGIDRELVKYPCKRIDLAEPDLNIFSMAERLKLIPVPHPPLRYIRTNLSTWINRPDTRYDVVLVMLPGPRNLSLNRFYTAGFFSRLNNCLTDGGVISVMLPGTANYVSDEAVSAIGPVVNAIRESFGQALLFPGENNYLIARDSSLNLDILSGLESRNIPALYISEGYFDEDLFRARLKSINSLMQPESAVNTDLRPTAYFRQIAWWLGHFSDRLAWPMAITLFLLILVSLLSGRAAYSGMFIMGAGASGTEIILLFLVQITAGSLYLFTGLLIAFFMGGLALGSLFGQSESRVRSTPSVSSILLAFIVITALIAVLAIWMTRTGNWIGIKTALVVVLAFSTAMITGMFFAKLTDLLPEPASAGEIYVFDLLGAAFGALVYPLVLIPLFGLLPAIGAISVSGVLILILLRGGRNAVRNTE